MKIYLINAETNELVREYKNVTSWGYNFVEFDNNGRCKIYCSENEYFTHEFVLVEGNADELNEELQKTTVEQ